MHSAVVIALAVGLGFTMPARADLPPLDYFTGYYERVGRDAEGKLMEGYVHLNAVGDALQLAECPLSALEPPMSLAYDNTFETPNFISGRKGPFRMACQFFNDSQNYPILNCWSDGGALFTLWPRGSESGCQGE